jgi:4-hydroxybenzoate polyprenyltransferase
VLFLLAAWRLGPLPFRLAPVALLVLFFYSSTKRFTWLSQFFLGLALAGAPLGAWIAVTGDLALPPVVLGLGVLTWVAGFDTIYACQDVDFDRQHGLHSLPARFGIARALLVTRALHAVAVLCLALFGWMTALGPIYAAGVVVVAAALVYENSLVRADDLSRVDKAFFDLNGFVSMAYLAAVLLARPWMVSA